MKYTIEKGVDVDCKKVETPALCVAAKKGNDKMIEFLISFGADVNAKDKRNGWNAIHFVAVNTVPLQILKLLVSRGCDFNVFDNRKKNALKLAREGNNLQIGEYLSELEIK
jgi:ankyrin repeat protein